MAVRNAGRLTHPIMYHGEGPFWDMFSNRLLCADVLAGDVVAIDLSGGVTRYNVPSPVVTVIRRRAKGGFVIAVEHGVISSDDDITAFDRMVDLVDDPAIRTNDGGCDPFGGFVIGTMAYDERQNAGAVYRMAPDRQVTQILSSVSISNGVQWSADGTQAYYIDTPRRRVEVFEVDPETATWSGRRVHIDLEDTQGYPDGMAIDDEDGLWVALWGGGCINHYDAAGRLIETIRIPGVTQVSSCAFGGERRDILFITTSRQGLSVGGEPAAGAVFAIQTETRGAPMWDFAG